MKQVSPTLNKLVLIGLFLLLVAGITWSTAIAAEDAVTTEEVWQFSAEIEARDTYAASDCVIPPSGPWPPCATGGGSSDNSNSGDCVIPPSGPWPPCATNGDGGGQTNTGGDQGNACPPSGPWPPGCNPNGGGTTTTNPADCVIPPSGPWPPCASNGNATGGSIDSRLNQGLTQLSSYWSKELTWRGLTPPTLTTFEIYNGDPGDPPNAFYIPSQKAIYIDRRLLDYYTAEFGNFAGVTVLAHEYAHFIQDELGLLVRSTPVRTIELQADCLTGSFTGYLRDTGQLGGGEYEIGAKMLYAVGDDQLSPDTTVPIWVAHGTAEERVESYNAGYNGSAQTCFDKRY